MRPIETAEGWNDYLMYSFLANREIVERRSFRQVSCELILTHDLLTQKPVSPTVYSAGFLLGESVLTGREFQKNKQLFFEGMRIVAIMGKCIAYTIALEMHYPGDAFFPAGQRLIIISDHKDLSPTLKTIPIEDGEMGRHLHKQVLEHIPSEKVVNMFKFLIDHNKTLLPPILDGFREFIKSANILEHVVPLDTFIQKRQDDLIVDCFPITKTNVPL